MGGPLVFRSFPNTTSVILPPDLTSGERYVWIIKACNRNDES
jgi:hypothetical protein